MHGTQIVMVAVRKRVQHIVAIHTDAALVALCVVHHVLLLLHLHLLLVQRMYGLVAGAVVQPLLVVLRILLLMVMNGAHCGVLLLLHFCNAHPFGDDARRRWNNG